MCFVPLCLPLYWIARFPGRHFIFVVPSKTKQGALHCSQVPISQTGRHTNETARECRSLLQCLANGYSTSPLFCARVCFGHSSIKSPWNGKKKNCQITYQEFSRSSNAKGMWAGVTTVWWCEMSRLYFYLNALLHHAALVLFLAQNEIQLLVSTCSVPLPLWD